MSIITPRFSVPQIDLSAEERKEFSDHKKRMKGILKSFNDIKGEIEPVYMGLYNCPVYTGLYNCSIIDEEYYDQIVSTESKRFINLYEITSADATVHLQTFIKLTTKVNSAIKRLSEQQKDLDRIEIDYKDLVFSWQEKLIYLEEIVHAILDRSEKAAIAVDYLRALEHKERIKIFGIWISPTQRTQRFYTNTLLTQIAAGNCMPTQSLNIRNMTEAKKALKRAILNPLFSIKQEINSELSKFNSIRNDGDISTQLVTKLRAKNFKNSLSQKIEAKLEMKLTNYRANEILYRWVKGIKEVERYIKSFENKSEVWSKQEFQEVLIEYSITNEALLSLITRCERAAKALERLQSAHWSQHSWGQQMALLNSMAKDNIDMTPKRAYTTSMLTKITAQVLLDLSDKEAQSDIV